MQVTERLLKQRGTPRSFLRSVPLNVLSIFTGFPPLQLSFPTLLLAFSRIFIDVPFPYLLSGAKACRNRQFTFIRT
ncbi:hypothetical protein BRYFOR_07358 [Marvinbryantia formatexigens DSM 14469]|uniref:Uncharacterized protein n=1 Tax=Marvinbryantia formatexigens DSM 14469 TaxID=478749 RepID=C6LFF6_9FIRM|nr:hypothetical protein BRYFOR_07358 [Marvinbryantia formatexigens DSM 14469]